MSRNPRLLAEDPLPDGFGRVAGDDCPRRHIFHGHGPGSDDGALANSYARPDKGVRTNPSLIFNDDWGLDEWQIRLRIVVCAGAELGAMLDSDFFAERNGAKIIDEGFFAHGAPITDG